MSLCQKSLATRDFQPNMPLDICYSRTFVSSPPHERVSELFDRASNNSLAVGSRSCHVTRCLSVGEFDPERDIIPIPFAIHAVERQRRQQRGSHGCSPASPLVRTSASTIHCCLQDKRLHNLPALTCCTLQR